jgi:hypothetical protein
MTPPSTLFKDVMRARAGRRRGRAEAVVLLVFLALTIASAALSEPLLSLAAR